MKVYTRSQSACLLFFLLRFVCFFFRQQPFADGNKHMQNVGQIVSLYFLTKFSRLFVCGSMVESVFQPICFG